MNRKIINLSEYQTKTPHSEYLFVDEQTRHDEDETLEDLNLSSEDKKLQIFLKQKGILTIRELKKGLEISSNSHIGVVQFSDFTIKVLPKFSLNPTNLPKMIAYAFELDEIIFPESETTFRPDDDSLIDIIISFFVKKCQKILRQGLLKTYVTYQADVKFLRGRLLLKQQMYNAIRHRPQFACEFDELEYDNLENQILLFSLRQSYRLTESDSLKREIRRLVRQFSDAVKDVQISMIDVESIQYTKLNKHYEPLHDLCKLIISATGISDFYKQNKNFVGSFFVDMNMIFEKFVTRLFHDHYPRDYLVEQQKGKRAWVSSDGNSSYIRTDILLTDQEGKKIIIDTKYKRKLSRDDPYQIGFYIHEYNEKKGYAILPKYADFSVQRISSHVQEITIDIKRLDIDQTLDLIYSKEEGRSEKIVYLMKHLVPPN